MQQVVLNGTRRHYGLCVTGARWILPALVSDVEDAGCKAWGAHHARNWTHPPQGETQTPIPEPNVSAARPTSVKPFGNLSWNFHSDR